MPTTVDPRCGRKIRALRKSAGIASEVDLNYTYLSKIETKSPAPSTGAPVRIADALDADADDWPGKSRRTSSRC